MADALYAERETYPSVIPGEEVMVIARDKGSEAAPPRIFIYALSTNTTFQVRTGQGANVDAFTNVIAGSGNLERGQKETVSLTSAVAVDHNVYVVRCLTGRLAVTVVAENRVQMQFRSKGR